MPLPNGLVSLFLRESGGTIDARPDCSLLTYPVQDRGRHQLGTFEYEEEGCPEEGQYSHLSER